MNQTQHTPAEAVQYWYDAAVERREERDRLRAVIARIRQMADHWEQNLPEVIRTPAVVSALRAALESAPAVVSPPTDRAAVLREAIAKVRAIPVQCTALTGPEWFGQGWKDAIGEFEEIADRLAVEAHGTEAQQPSRCTCTHARAMHTGPNLFCAVPGCECARYAGAQQPDTEAPWQSDGARIGRALIWSWSEVGRGEFGRGYRAAQEEARAILTRPLMPAPVAQQPAAVETDEERANREATERDHARADHTYCGITCEIEMPTEHLRNFVIAKGYPGTRGALDELLRRARAEVAEQQAAAADDEETPVCPDHDPVPNYVKGGTSCLSCGEDREGRMPTDD